jgi:hypothetical protein
LRNVSYAMSIGKTDFHFMRNLTRIEGESAIMEVIEI